jgi:hypothetical protein
MNEASARQVVLLQAFETASDVGSRWGAQDSAWASRAALESVSADEPADRFIAERAAHAMQRLAPRDPAVAGSLRRRVWRASWWVGASLLGLLAGLLADAIGSGQRINLLAPPLWGVVAWNGVVYLLLLGAALRVLMARRGALPGLVARSLQRVFDLSGTRRLADRSAVSQTFASAWLRLSTPLSAARASALMHTAAAALGAGLVAGMYLRGLVLDYRAGWESTFLDATQVHAALSVLLAPALAVSGLALPDAAALQALRFVADAPGAGAPAAAWIHLCALTLALFVVLPRALLALWSAWRASALARRFPLPLDDAYFQRLLRHRQGGTVRVQVLPYAQAPGPQAEQGLRAAFGRLCGDAAQVHVAPLVAFGAEDDVAAAARIPPGTTVVAALFDLTATPEAENQGRFVQGLSLAAAAGGRSAAVLVLVDEAAFVARFGPVSPRRAQRREAWQGLARNLGTTPVFLNLAEPDLVAAEAALQAALGQPAQGASPSAALVGPG